jgi:hypothetical protein
MECLAFVSLDSRPDGVDGNHGMPSLGG